MRSYGAGSTVDARDSAVVGEPLMAFLDGVRVIEAASYLSGPVAGLVLADLGAEVIKVEQSPDGDPFRRFGRRSKGHGLMFINSNRGKKSVLLDLKEPAGVEKLGDLLSTADIFISNWRPGAAERLGLSAEHVRETHPRLIWVRISGFGQDGPLGRRPAFDPLVQARSGLAHAQGKETPELVHTYMADKVAALFVTQTALAALHDRKNGGNGAVIDISMLECLSYFNFPDMLVEQILIGQALRKVDRASPVRPLRTADGWMLVSPVSGRQISAAFTALGRPDAILTLKEIKDGVAMTNLMYDLLEEEFQNWTTAELETALVEHDVPCSPVLDFEQHINDPQVLFDELYLSIDDPHIGPVRRVRYPAVVDGQRDTKPGQPSPSPGQHNG